MKPKTLLIKRIGKLYIALLFEVRDLWVGVYWDKVSPISSNPIRWSVYICLIPTLPIRIQGRI